MSGPEDGERLQKILAASGVASRRAAEVLIAAGRVSVNGSVVKEMGQRARPGVDRIELDGRPVGETAATAPTSFTYIALNKPVGVVTTSKDTHGRQTVLDLLKGSNLRERGVRVYPVGRLDAESTGLLLLTNDGELTFRLTHPRYGVEKEYRALVRGRPAPHILQKLREGVEVEGERTAPAEVEEVGKKGTDTWLRVTIHEGKKRQIRLMCAAVGHPVIELQRVRFGPLTLGDLDPGRWRYLATHEVHALRMAVKLKRLGSAPAPAGVKTGGTRPPLTRRPVESRNTKPEEKKHGPGAPGATPRPSREQPGRSRPGRPARPAAPQHRDRRPGGRG